VPENAKTQNGSGKTRNGRGPSGLAHGWWSFLFSSVFMLLLYQSQQSETQSIQSWWPVAAGGGSKPEIGSCGGCANLAAQDTMCETRVKNNEVKVCRKQKVQGHTVWINIKSTEQPVANGGQEGRRGPPAFFANIVRVLGLAPEARMLMYREYLCSNILTRSYHNESTSNTNNFELLL